MNKLKELIGDAFLDVCDYIFDERHPIRKYVVAVITDITVLALILPPVIRFVMMTAR